jgi:hypothetical protein
MGALVRFAETSFWLWALRAAFSARRAAVRWEALLMGTRCEDEAGLTGTSCEDEARRSRPRGVRWWRGLARE